MKKYIIIFVTIVSVFGCKKGYLDINENPNQPGDGLISTPDLILPRALHATAARHGAGYATLANWCGQWSRGGDFGPNVQTETYQVVSTFSDATWNAVYDNAYDYEVMDNKAKAANQNFYSGIAKTMKVVCFYELVDLFNNVPYKQAFGTSPLPAYDKGTDIYKDLFVKLDEALALINGAGVDPNIATADIMFKGNKVKWRKFINTVRLKLVLRLVNTTGIITPATELAKITTDGCIGAGETAAVNPGYKASFSGSNISQQNPFWDNYKKLVNGNEATRSARANAFTMNILNAAPIDVRREYYFDTTVVYDPIAGNYVGTIYGQAVIPLNSDNQSGIGGPGLAKSADQAQWILTATESLFLQAEAKLRYTVPTIAGTDETLFTAAVNESFAWLGVPNAGTAATNYLASNKTAVIGTNIIPLTAYATSTNKLQTLIHQKYFSLVGVANFEIYADLRRTGPNFPNVPRSAANNVGTAYIPKRYPLPQVEYNTNAANAEAEGSINIQTSKIFWMP
jgi:Starch-binding associating with outer membrane